MLILDEDKEISQFDKLKKQERVQKNLEVN